MGVVLVTLLGVFALMTMTGLLWSTGNMPADPRIAMAWLNGTPFLGLLIALPIAAWAWFLVRTVLRAKEQQETTLDEGGLRWRRGLARGYEPFARIADVRAEKHGLRGTVLAVTRTDGSVLRLPSGAEPEIMQRILQKMWTPAPAAETSAPLARAGAPISEWLTRLDALAAHEEGGYRDASLGTARLSAIAVDPARDAELRAAATYVLARRGDASARAVVHRALAGDPPPILIALAALAGGYLVPEGDLARALTFLDPEDRAYAHMGPRVRVRVDGPDESMLLDEPDPAEAPARAARRL